MKPSLCDIKGCAKEATTDAEGYSFCEYDLKLVRAAISNQRRRLFWCVCGNDHRTRKEAIEHGTKKEFT